MEPVLLAHEPDLVLVVGDVNRILTDAIADYLFVTEEDAIGHLLKEGRPLTISLATS